MIWLSVNCLAIKQLANFNNKYKLVHNIELCISPMVPEPSYAITMIIFLINLHDQSSDCILLQHESTINALRVLGMEALTLHCDT